MLKHRTKLVAPFLLVAAVTLMHAMTAAADTLDDIKSRGKMIVAIDPTFAPYEYTDANDKIVGYDPAIMAAVAKHLGVTIEYQRMAFERPDIAVLCRRLRPHRTLAQIDLFEARACAGRREVEQGALRDREPDGALDVAGNQFIAALEPLIEPLQHASRLLAGFARSHDGDLVSALVGYHPQAALDQGEILSVLAEQQRGEPVVVEGERDLRRRGLRHRIRRCDECSIVRPCGAQRL